MRALLDAKGWKSTLDFYDALFVVIGAPKWHGCSPDALVDSMIWGGINDSEPPITILIERLSDAPKEVREHVQLVADDLRSARKGWREAHNGADIEVAMTIL